MSGGWIAAAALAIALASGPALGQIAKPPVPPAASQSMLKIGPLSDADERAPKTGETFKECDGCPEMVVVPAGRFTMGSPDNDPDRLLLGADFEGPQHQVTFARPFAVGKFAVTFAEWDACVADGGCNGYRPNDGGWGHGRQPVINVSWSDAQSYVAWLSRRTGKPYRLLSESEREYVTRAGTATPFWWGVTISLQQANYCLSSEALLNNRKDQCRQQTVPVDWYQPNPWGLYQVHGNVYEWTEDCWNPGYEGGAPTDGSAWTGGDCGRRVLRGGSFGTLPRFLRSAYRFKNRAGYRDSDQGFRVARSFVP